VTRFPDWTAAEVVTAAKLDKVSLDYVLKTADESVASSTTLQNDNHLAYTVGATGTYVFDLWLYCTSAANAAGDIKFGFTFPTGTCHFSANGPDSALASGTVQSTQWQAITSATSGTSALGFGASTSTNALEIRGILIATATGTLQLQWAQLASNASASTILAGSHMITRQVA
jgi:hypothetical protein